MNETSDAMKREPEIRAEVARLQSETQQLDKSVEVLIGRLSEVLRKTEPTDMAYSADEEASFTDLGARIRNEVGDIQRLNRLLVGIIDRLEV